MDSTIINGQKSANLLSMISMDNINIINTGIVTASPITPTTNDSTPTSTSMLTETLPFDTNGNILTDNPNPNTVIVQYKPNFSPMMAWLYNSYSDLLATYENLFVNNGRSAFIEMSAITSNAIVATSLNSPIVGPSH
jgi:hypothetical protein